MKYKYATIYCLKCRKLTKWQKECPRGKWQCMECKPQESEEESEVGNDK